MKLGIVVSEYNEEITKVMKSVAQKHAKSLGWDTVIQQVPGTFDIPFGVRKIIDQVDALATLGAIIQGETDHDIVIANAMTSNLLTLSQKYNKPISLGVIGPRASRREAEERKEKYAKQAVEAAIKLAQ